jgi:hypothetical protein
MEVQSRLKSAVSAAKTRARLRAELAVAEDEYRRAQAVWREVEALPAPLPELLEGRARRAWGEAGLGQG